ncbi:MAG TPA: hypothetical protein VGG68_12785 [Caulobacteraceae bacterium]|jgi:hypothetical protein
MKLAIATALAAISLAGSVFAETTVTATLDSAQASRVKFIAADAVWDCSGTSCVASVAPDSAGGVAGCKELAKKIGHIVSYSTDMRTLDSKALERCNIAAATPTATASR